MSRVIFVGMHNKRGMMPLDSKTATGKVIDRLIAELGCKCLKTNLMDIDYMPFDRNEIQTQARLWYDRINPTNQDLIVLLGQWVFENFMTVGVKTVKLAHPAGMMRKGSNEQYQTNSINKIKNALCHEKLP